MDAAVKVMQRYASVRGDRTAVKAATVRIAAGTLPLLREIADPRGRCNRQAFLHIALAFLALQFGVAGLFWLLGVEMDETGTLLLNAPILWVGTTVCVKRLHDVGRRGWWIPGASGIWFVAAMTIATIVSIVLGADAVEPGKPAFLAVFAAITLPVFGALLWLHTAPSMALANRFGPVPDGMGLSMPPKMLRVKDDYVTASVLA